jgi:hypothetical protein
MIKIKSYGRTQEFETREQAQAFYRRCLMCSEGSEQSTYADILWQLASGCTDITDDPYPYGKVIRY